MALFKQMKHNRMTAWIILLLIGEMLVVSVNPNECSTFTSQKLPLIKHFNQTLSSTHELLNITTALNQSKECPLDLCQLLRISNQGKTGLKDSLPKLISVRVHCVQPQLVTFQGTNCSQGRGYKHTYDFSIKQCRLKGSTLQRLFSSFNVIEVGLHNTEVLPVRVRKPHRTTSGALNTISVSSTDLSKNYQLFFPRNMEYRGVFSCSLENTSLSRLPGYIQQTLPRLQYLDMSGNMFKSPPDFPWDPTTYNLSVNSISTRNYAKLCMKTYNIDIPDRIIPRILILDRNNISSLKNFTFKNFLHVLSLARNALRLVGDNTFSKLQNLQHLNISNNQLEEFPPFCNVAVCKLRVLDLHRNIIDRVSRDTFQNLLELRMLSIAHNRLKDIEANTFAHLASLNILHLEHNRIKFIHPHSLPTSYVALREIHLHHNPLVNVPAPVFLLPEIDLVDLSSCEISFDSFYETLDDLHLATFVQVLAKEENSQVKDYTKALDALIKHRGQYTRVVKLSNNNVTSIPVPFLLNTTDRVSLEMELKYRLLLVHFKLDLSNNPLSCDCHMADILVYMENLTHPEKGTFLGNEYFFKEWLCSYPKEFDYKPVFDFKPRDLYCPVLKENMCLQECKCYEYFGNHGYLVDCSDSDHSELPETVPQNTITLRLQNNTITKLAYRDYLKNVDSLDVSWNNLKYIQSETFGYMTRLRKLHLDHNSLQTLPREITRLDSLVKVTISHNSFLCDCENLWIKEWLLGNQYVVEDVNEVFCVKSDQTSAVMVEVKDFEFVCKENKTYSQLAMCIPSLTVGVILVCLVTYVYRLEIRALVYSTTKVPLFDTLSQPTENETIEILIVSCEKDSALCDQQIVPIFSSAQGYRSVVVAGRDLIAGLTRVQNLSWMIEHSYRMVAVVSQHFLFDELCVLALDKALQKSRSKKEFLIVIEADNIHKTNLHNDCKQLKQFYKKRRYQCIRISDRLRRRKLRYLTRRPRDRVEAETAEWGARNQQSLKQNSRICQYDIYIAHADEEYQWVFHELKRKLDSEGFSTRLADLHFTPGESIQNNIVEHVDCCRYTLLILSAAFLASEWPLFIMRIAYEITLRDNTNNLIVLLYEDLDPSSIQDADLVMFLRTYVYLCKSDSDWWTKLKRSLVKTKTLGPAQL